MLIKNTFWLSASYLITKAITLFWQIYLAKAFCDDLKTYGEYTFLTSNLAVWLPIADGSLTHVYQTLKCSGLRNHSEIQSHTRVIYALRIVLGIISFFGFITSVVLQSGFISTAAIIIAFQLIVVAIGTSPLPILAAKQKFQIEAISTTLSSLFFVLPAFVLIDYNKSITLIAFFSLFGTVVSCLYIYKSHNEPDCVFKIISINDLTLISNYVKLCIPFTVSAFLFAFLIRCDIAYVYRSHGAETVGVYSVATMVFFIVLDLIWGQFGKAYTPTISAGWSVESERKIFKNRIRWLFKIFSLITTVAIILEMLFYNSAMKLVIGPRTALLNSEPLLIILSVGCYSVIGHSIIVRLLMVESGVLGINLSLIAGIVFKFVVLYLFPALDIESVAIVNISSFCLVYLVSALFLNLDGRSVFLSWDVMAYCFFPQISVMFIWFTLRGFLPKYVFIGLLGGGLILTLVGSLMQLRSWSSFR